MVTNLANFHGNSSLCDLTCHLAFSLRSVPLTSTVIPVKFPPTQKHLEKIKSACRRAVCRAFTCQTDALGAGKEKGERERERPPVSKLLDILRCRKAPECSGFSNSLRNVSKKGRRSLLLANNSSSCSQAVSLYEKIWGNDAVRVYHDLVWRRNPIKMMKKPHLRTSRCWARWQSIRWSEGRGSTGRRKWLLSLSWQEMLHLCDV